MNLQDCYNFEDFRKLAKKKLPAPIFHYIDGGADDEVTLNRNTDAFNDCDLVPNILNSVGEPDLSTTVFGRKISMPLFLSPTAMQSLYDPEGESLKDFNIETLHISRLQSGFWSNSLLEILKQHARETNSAIAKRLVNDWLLEIQNFWHVVPTEILKMLEPPLDSENIVGKIA